MSVYPVAYKIRSDKVLVKVNHLPKSEFLDFDKLFQIYSSPTSYKRQFDDGVIYALRNSAISLFFVFDIKGKLHLFNSRFEVSRFLKKENFM